MRYRKAHPVCVPILWAGVPGWIRRRETVEHQHPSLHFLTADAMQVAASRPCRCIPTVLMLCNVTLARVKNEAGRGAKKNTELNKNQFKKTRPPLLEPILPWVVGHRKGNPFTVDLVLQKESYSVTMPQHGGP